MPIIFVKVRQTHKQKRFLFAFTRLYNCCFRNQTAGMNEEHNASETDYHIFFYKLEI